MPPFTLTRAQVRELDRRAMDEYGIPGIVLMENAGRGCAELLMRLNPEKKRTLILCGPGNNGGDGFVMARPLDNAGWEVNVQAIAVNNGGLSGDAEVNFEVLVESDVQVGQCNPSYFLDPVRYSQFLTLQFNPAVWIVDALFGTGLSRPLTEPFNEIAALINASGKPVLAIDIPSGLDCDTGEPLGPTVRAKHTATFVAPKRGFLNPKSREWIGEVHVIDIGVPRKLVDEYRS